MLFRACTSTLSNSSISLLLRVQDSALFSNVGIVILSCNSSRTRDSTLFRTSFDAIVFIVAVVACIFCFLVLIACLPRHHNGSTVQQRFIPGWEESFYSVALHLPVTTTENHFGCVNGPAATHREVSSLQSSTFRCFVYRLRSGTTPRSRKLDHQ